MKSKILISGGNGDFAKKFADVCKKEDAILFPMNKKEMDITNILEIEDAINRINPEYFIHAGALTRPMSIHEQDPGRSILNNIIGTANVTLACMKRDIKLVYLSTDHIYQGTIGNYSEEDPVLPVNNYAWSKLGGECSVRLYNNSCILRLSMIKNPFPHELALADSYKSSIFIEDAAEICFRLIDKTGTYNVGAESMSIYEFAKKHNSNIDKIFLKDIKNVNMPSDVTMNLEKMKRALEND